MAQQDWSTVGKPVRKKDAMALLLGKPAYLDDLTPKDCLVVKVLRSRRAALSPSLPTRGRSSAASATPAS